MPIVVKVPRMEHPTSPKGQLPVIILAMLWVDQDTVMSRSAATSHRLLRTDLYCRALLHNTRMNRKELPAILATSNVESTIPWKLLSQRATSSKSSLSSSLPFIAEFCGLFWRRL